MQEPLLYLFNAKMSTKTVSRFMMMIFIIGSAFATKAQNLVPNPSFENAICPTGYNGFPNQVALYMNDWYSATCASPDIMTTCSNHPNTTIPNVLFGYQYARTGSNFAGFGFYNSWYEYLGVKLTQPLVAGTVYNVSFYASCANSMDKATDALGIYFSQTEIKCISGFSGPVLNYTPQVVQTPGVFLNDTLGWQQVSGSFTAQGGEEYIVVGYFKPWNVADLQSINNGTGTRCYYYVDDFSVEAVSLPAQPGAISGLQTICEGSTQTFSVTAVSGATSYTWTLPNGWTGTSTTNSITATVGPNSGNVSVTANNSAGSSPAQNLTVNVTTFPAQPGTLTGPLNVCSGQSITYSVSPVAGADSYYWTLPSGWVGSSSSTSITVTTGSTGGTIIAHAQNGCGTSGSQTNITVQNPNVNVTINNAQLVAVSGQQSYQWLDCGDNLNEIPAENQSIFSPSVSGNYAVAIAQNGCTDTSSCIAFSFGHVGIKENNAGISVYPNPVKNDVYVIIENPASSAVLFSITDLSGKNILNGQSNLSQTTTSIHVPENIPNGIYLLEIRNETSKFFQKIVIER
jgi:hypothetical protein